MKNLQQSFESWANDHFVSPNLKRTAVVSIYEDANIETAYHGFMAGVMENYEELKNFQRDLEWLEKNNVALIQQVDALNAKLNDEFENHKAYLDHCLQLTEEIEKLEIHNESLQTIIKKYAEQYRKTFPKSVLVVDHKEAEIV